MWAMRMHAYNDVSCNDASTISCVSMNVAMMQVSVPSFSTTG